MPNENIFDLTQSINIPPKETYKHDKISIKPAVSNEEISDTLQGYTEVSSDNWDTMIIGSHIRYLRKDGLFRSGGYIKNTWMSTQGKNKNKLSIQLGSGLSYKSPTWNITLTDIDKIWIRNVENSNNIDNSQLDELHKISKNNTESIEYLTKSVSQVKIDIAKLNNEQQRIINLIKKLHNIKSRPSKPMMLMKH